MAEKEVKIKVVTETEAESVEDLSQMIQELQNSKVNVDFNVDDTSVSELSNVIDNVNGENVELRLNTEDGELNEAYALVTDLDGTVTRINIDTNDGSLEDVQDEIDKITSSNINLEVYADNTQLEDTTDIIDEINNLPVNVDVNVDTSTLQSELDSAINEVESLESELANIELGTVDADFTEVSSQLEEASNRVDELQSQLDNLNAGNTTEISGSFDEIGNSVNNANTEIDEMQGNLDMINAGALIGIGSELGSLGDKAEGMAQNMDQAAISVGQLATNTGMAEPQLVDLINNISNATFPQNEAIAYVEMLNQMGVSANNLGDSATNIDRINDATGMGYQNAMQLVRGFGALGVQGDNLESTFNAVAYAQSNSVGGAADMGQILKMQAGTLNEYHVGVDAATVAISDLSHKYGSARKAGAALSSALKDNNGDLKAVEQQLGLNDGALTNASDITGQYQGKLMELANQEAEHKTPVQQLSAAYEDLTLKMSPVLTPLASFMGLIGQAGSFAVGANGINTLVKSLTGLDILNSVNGRFSALRQTISSVGSTVRNAGAGFLQFGRDLGGSVLNAVKNAISSLITLGKEVWTAGVNAIKSAGAWLIAKGQMIASTIATWAQTAAQTALNFVMNANPIMLVVMAIGALIAVLGYLYFNNEQVRAAIDGLGQTFMWVGQIIYDSFVNAINWIIGALQNFYNYVMTLGGLLPNGVNVTGNQIIDSILAFLVFFATLPIQIGVILLNTLAKVFGFKGNFVQSVVSAATNAVNGFANAIKGIGQAVQNCLNWAYNIFMSHPIVQAAVDLGRAIANGFSALGLGQHSPGRIYKAMHSELDWTSELINSDNSLINDASRLGSDIVGAFGNPSLGVDTDFENSEFLNATVSDESKATGNAQPINIYISDVTVDDDKRMNKIVDEITRRLAFNNETAGRTV